MRQHGRRRVIFYGCSAYHRTGKSVCNNALTVRAEVLENAVLREVEGVALGPVVIQAALDRAVECIVGDRNERLWNASGAASNITGAVPGTA